jgi:hypothetical protein
MEVIWAGLGDAISYITRLRTRGEAASGEREPIAGRRGNSLRTSRREQETSIAIPKMGHRTIPFLQTRAEELLIW